MSRLFGVVLVFLLAVASAPLLVTGQSSVTNYTGSYTAYPIPWGSTACSNARGMAVDSSGNMYVACGQVNGSIVVMDSNGNFLRNITNGGWAPFGIAFSGSYMYVTSLWTNQVFQLTTSSGQVVTSWSSYLYEPWGVAVDGSGYVYVANYGLGNIIKFSSSGGWQQNFSTSNPAMYYPEEVAIDSSGNLYVVDTDNDRIVKFNSAGSVVATYNQTTPPLNEPGGIALDTQGSIYVCDTWNYAVIKLSSAGVQIETLSSPLASGTVQVSAAAGLTIDSANQVYVVDSISNNRILKFPATLSNSSPATATASVYVLVAAALVAALAVLKW